MSKIQIIIDSIAGAVGAVLGFMYGEVTGLFWALIAFMALDYVTGVIVAIIENAAALGLPVPKKLTNIMEQIKNKSESEEE